VAFLGHVISESGIEVHKKTKWLQFATSRRQRTCRSCVHFLGSVRTTGASFLVSPILQSPLHCLLRKQANFIWTAEQEEEFNCLKQRLTTAPVLGMPTNEGQFYLDCDASNVVLGVVLSQKQGESQAVIAYASRSLTKAERNYDQSIIILSEQMQKHCSHCTSIWGDITCRENDSEKR